MRVEIPSVADVPAAFWHWPHFRPDELACPEAKTLVVDEAFMERLERVRVRYARPIIVNSWYRSPAYNNRIAETGETGPHTTGRAVDVRVYGPWALELLAIAREEGFTGFGVRQTLGLPSIRHYLHMDDLEATPARPRPNLWSYPN